MTAKEEGYIEVAIPSIDARLKAVEEEAFRLKDELAIADQRAVNLNTENGKLNDELGRTQNELAEAQRTIATQQDNIALVALHNSEFRHGLIAKDGQIERLKMMVQERIEQAERDSEIIASHEDVIMKSESDAIKALNEVHRLNGQIVAKAARIAELEEQVIKLEDIMQTSDDIWAKQVMEAESQALRARQDALEEAAKAVRGFRHVQNSEVGLINLLVSEIRALSGPEGGQK